MLSRSGSCGTTTSRDTVPWRRLSGTCSQLAGIDPGLPCRPVCPVHGNPGSWALGQAGGTGNGSPALAGMVAGQQTTSATS